jgi:hypothetical protein
MTYLKAPNTSVWFKDGVIHVASPRNPKYHITVPRGSTQYKVLLAAIEENHAARQEAEEARYAVGNTKPNFVPGK